MADYTTKDAVSYALSGNSGEFKKAIHDLLTDKINDAVELKKFDVATTFMNTKEEEPVVEPEESENETTEDTRTLTKAAS